MQPAAERHSSSKAAVADTLAKQKKTAHESLSAAESDNAKV